MKKKTAKKPEKKLSGKEKFMAMISKKGKKKC